MADGIYFETTSLIDGSPLLVVLRGAHAARAKRDEGANDKTGAMIQSYIMPRDIAPGEAARTGADESVCGDCPHRPILARVSGNPRCYVNLAHGPRVVFEAVKRGAYRLATLAEACDYVRGLPTRFGSWGDPGAVDPAIWIALAAHASERTGYTHRWRDTGAALKGICMASVDSEDERDAAHAAGWATFGVDEDGSWQRTKGEARCPASAEAGKQVTCRTCPIKCNGAGLSVVIMDHAAGGIGRTFGRR